MRSPDTKTLSFEIGLLLRGAFRSYLGRQQFLGEDIGWHEEKGFLSSTFTIRGASRSVDKIERYIDMVLEDEALEA